MTKKYIKISILKFVLIACLLPMLQACSSTGYLGNVENSEDIKETPQYIIGAGDMLRVFVWGNTDLSGEVPVRPDGRITTPLVEDLVASGRTPTQLARELETKLKRYMKKPVVTVTVTNFTGRYTEQIRVVGEVGSPRTLPYREYITVLDVIIAVNGLTEFAAGNRASIARTVNGKIHKIPVRLSDLLDQGDISANVQLQPGDILFVPEAWF
ncbi:MAG: polysaccharide export protein [Gammaproteobacteria bacterium]|nr:polysaccharide export protein [Gammaproteobacteria bacterium]